MGPALDNQRVPKTNSKKEKKTKEENHGKQSLYAI